MLVVYVCLPLWTCSCICVYVCVCICVCFRVWDGLQGDSLCVYIIAGLLLSYELPVQTDRNGKPIDRFLISRSRSYQQTLAALIHEVHTCINLAFLCLSCFSGFYRWNTNSFVFSRFGVQVNIQPSEWHRALLLPQAWRGFMSRAFHAVLQVCYHGNWKTDFIFIEELTDTAGGFRGETFSRHCLIEQGEEVS